MLTEQNELQNVNTVKTSTTVVKEVVPDDAKKQKKKAIINVVAGSIIYHKRCKICQLLLLSF